MEQQKYYTREQAAEYLRTVYGFRCRSSLLQKLASKNIGGGPKYIHIGKYAHYSRQSLDSWAMGRINRCALQTSAHREQEKAA